MPTTKQRRVHSSCDESDSSCEEDSSCDDDGTRADGNCDGTLPSNDGDDKDDDSMSLPDPPQAGLD